MKGGPLTLPLAAILPVVAVKACEVEEAPRPPEQPGVAHGEHAQAARR